MRPAFGRLLSLKAPKPINAERGDFPGEGVEIAPFEVIGMGVVEGCDTGLAEGEACAGDVVELRNGDSAFPTVLFQDASGVLRGEPGVSPAVVHHDVLFWDTLLQ